MEENISEYGTDENICEVVKSILEISNIEIQSKFINYPSLDKWTFISSFAS